MSPSSRALITGASSGIGMEFAWLLATRGRDLIITARREERLQQLQHELEKAHAVKVEVIRCDLATTEGPQELYTEVRRRGLEVDTLINNAGYGRYEDFLIAPPEQINRMIQLNITALTKLSYLFGQEMKERGQGSILLVASTAGLQPLPHYAVYAATKAYVLSLGEALHRELKNYGIRVCTLSPGLTQTEFFEISGYPHGKAMESITMDAHHVAEIGLEALEKDRPGVIPGLFNKITAGLLRWIPRCLTRPLIYRAMKRK